MNTELLLQLYGFGVIATYGYFCGIEYEPAMTNKQLRQMLFKLFVYALFWPFLLFFFLGAT